MQNPVRLVPYPAMRFNHRAGRMRIGQDPGIVGIKEWNIGCGETKRLDQGSNHCRLSRQLAGVLEERKDIFGARDKIKLLGH